MFRVDPSTGRQKWYSTNGFKSVVSALISILIGMAVGSLIIVIVGLTKDGISTKGIVSSNVIVTSKKNRLSARH